MVSWGFVVISMPAKLTEGSRPRALLLPSAGTNRSDVSSGQAGFPASAMLSLGSITVDPIIFYNRRGRGREWQILLLSLTRAIPPFIIINKLTRTACHGHSRSMNRETPNRPCNS